MSKKYSKEGVLVIDETGIEDEKIRKLVKKERFQRLRKKVFSIPFLTMLGIWILVYYQFMSHFHDFPMDYSSFETKWWEPKVIKMISK